MGYDGKYRNVVIGMKLISLNLEGRKHSVRIQPFLLSEQPDVICLQECPEEMQWWLTERGYHCNFAPMKRDTQADVTYLEGNLFASKLPHTAKQYYYFGSPESIVMYDRLRRRESIAHVVIVAQVAQFTFATTHLPAPPERGEAFYEPLATDIANLRSYLSSELPHILCGDMNTPRNINPSHSDLVHGYTDAIPHQYTSSLDPSLHRLGGDPEKSLLFASFMVDYLLLHSPYTAENVRLQFGLSDHAAIIAEVERTAQ